MTAASTSWEASARAYGQALIAADRRVFDVKRSVDLLTARLRTLLDRIPAGMTMTSDQLHELGDIEDQLGLRVSRMLPNVVIVPSSVILPTVAEVA